MTGNSNICVSNKLIGIQHPYSYCVTPTSEMVPADVTNGDGWSMENTGKVVRGLFNYVKYLTVDANIGTATECTKAYSGPGIIGNRYVLKTNIKCRKLTATGLSGEEYLHKYIDNTSTIGGLITGGRPMPDANGLIPSVFASAGKISGNVLDVISAFSADTKPYCIPVKLKCHVIDSSVPSNSYAGPSPEVYLSLDDVADIHSSLFAETPTIPPIPEDTSTEEFTTATPATTTTTTTTTKTAPPPRQDADFTNLIDNIIYQNTDKVQGSTDFESVINKINFEDELLVKIYYVGFSIFIIILIFKLINKR